jgi:hypothetical protein
VRTRINLEERIGPSLPNTFYYPKSDGSIRYRYIDDRVGTGTSHFTGLIVGKQAEELLAHYPYMLRD